MLVYKIEPTYRYAYGCALVAANNEDEAINLYRNSNEYRDYSYEEYDCVCELVDNLVYNCEEPTIIIDTVNSE